MSETLNVCDGSKGVKGQERPPAMTFVYLCLDYGCYKYDWAKGKDPELQRCRSIIPWM